MGASTTPSGCKCEARCGCTCQRGLYNELEGAGGRHIVRDHHVYIWQMCAGPEVPVHRAVEALQQLRRATVDTQRQRGASVGRIATTETMEGIA